MSVVVDKLVTSEYIKTIIPIRGMKGVISMPSYDLLCQKCAKKFSVFCSISQKDHQACPYCGSDQIIQRFTSVNIGGKSFGSDSGSSGGFNAPRQRFS